MSTIEPLAREVCGRICRRNDVPEDEIFGQVEVLWEEVAAKLEAGKIDENGESIPDIDWRKGLGTPASE